MKGFRLVQDFFFCNERIYLRGKVLKNQRYDGNDSAELKFQQGLQLILVESCRPLRACWTGSLWEARETGIIAFPWKGSSYRSCRVGRNPAVLLTPTFLGCFCYRSCFGFHWGAQWGYICYVPAISSSFSDSAGSFIFSQCGWYNYGHFSLSQIVLCLYICHLMCKLKILGLIQNMLQLCWNLSCDEVGLCGLAS